MKKFFILAVSIASSLFSYSNAAEIELKDPQACGDCHHRHDHDRINHYDLLITVGMDENLDENSLSYGIQVFDNIGWDADKVEQFRQSAIAWAWERFGVDFRTAYYDISSGVTDNGYASLVPLQLNGTYRILESSDNRIRPDTKINITEFVTVFHPDVSQNYGGTYGNGGPNPIAINPSDSLPYGVYTVFTSKHHPLEFFMRGLYPDITQPLSVYPTRSIEQFQMFNRHYGPGFGILYVAVPGAANSNGKWPSLTRGQWTFPGSFVIPDLNGFVTSPVD